MLCPRSVDRISDPARDSVHSLPLHAYVAMEVLTCAHVASGVRPAINKNQLLDVRIAEPLECGRHLVWSAMDAGIFGMVEHQHRNLDRRQVLLRYRAGLLVVDHAGGQHQPGNVALHMDGGRSGRDRAPAGADNPDRRGALGLHEVQHLAHIGHVGVADAVGIVQVFRIAGPAKNRHVEPIGGEVRSRAHQKVVAGRLAVFNLAKASTASVSACLRMSSSVLPLPTREAMTQYTSACRSSPAATRLK